VRSVLGFGLELVLEDAGWGRGLAANPSMRGLDDVDKVGRGGLDAVAAIPRAEGRVVGHGGANDSTDLAGNVVGAILEASVHLGLEVADHVLLKGGDPCVEPGQLAQQLCNEPCLFGHGCRCAGSRGLLVLLRLLLLLPLLYLLCSSLTVDVEDSTEGRPRWRADHGMPRIGA
jgi:hypothetical protein